MIKTVMLIFSVVNHIKKLALSGLLRCVLFACRDVHSLLKQYFSQVMIIAHIQRL